MKKYKYTTDAPKKTGRFLFFQDGETKDVKVTDWDFSKNPSGYLFRAYVIEENGEEVDKIWTVWEYEFAQKLKKALGVKPSGAKELRVNMTKEDDEMVFTLLPKE